MVKGLILAPGLDKFIAEVPLKELEPDHTAFHTKNPNYFIGVKRRGMGARRIDVEDFNLRGIASELEKEFGIVSRVARQYFPGQVSSHK